MRWILSGCAILALAACDPPVPDSAAGVGFDNRNLNPSGTAGYESALPPAQAVSSETLDLLAATAPETAEGAESFVEASPANPAPLQLENAGISDENDFGAVDARRSIEADAERRAHIAAQYEVVAATDLPERQSAGPNIVQYALNSSNPLGNPIYRRVTFNAESKFERNCRSYPSADQAQIDFLERGGPERDRLGLDPDGDGYACSWDPRPFQSLKNG